MGKDAGGQASVEHGLPVPNLLPAQPGIASSDGKGLRPRTAALNSEHPAWALCVPGRDSYLHSTKEGMGTELQEARGNCLQVIWLATGRVVS